MHVGGGHGSGNALFLRHGGGHIGQRLGPVRGGHDGRRHRHGPVVDTLIDGEHGAALLGSLADALREQRMVDRKSTRLNSSHLVISYAVFCLKKKKKIEKHSTEM